MKRIFIPFDEPDLEYWFSKKEWSQEEATILILGGNPYSATDSIENLRGEDAELYHAINNKIYFLEKRAPKNYIARILDLGITPSERIVAHLNCLGYEHEYSEESEIIKYYKRWLNLDLWKKDEAVLLINSVDTKYYDFMDNTTQHEYSEDTTDEICYFDIALSPHLYPQRLKKCEECWILLNRSISSGSLKTIDDMLSPNDVINWSIEKQIEAPQILLELIWRDSEKKETISRPNQLHKNICQAVAKTLWDIHPDMTIEEMKTQNAILEHGFGKHYTGKDTIPGWLREVDPRPSENKRGPKKKIPAKNK